MKSTLFIISMSVASLSAADEPKTPPAAAVALSPAKEAMKAFSEGRHAKAVELARPLAERGDGEAIYLLGFANESGKGVEQSKEKAIEYYRRAISVKNTDAIYRLALILLSSEKEESRTEGRELLEKAAKDDPTVAGRILGEAYLQGRFTKKSDPEKAVYWWKLAADAKDTASILLLARLYEGQFGFPEMTNNKEAYALYTKAANLGDAGAKVTLGSRLLGGDEKLRDEALGRDWLKKAIEDKQYTAYLILGMYEETVKKNLKAALAEFERGKDVGQVDCLLKAADSYLQGKGVEKDAIRGLALLEKAAEANSAEANYRLAALSFSKEPPAVLNGYSYLVKAANGSYVEAQSELGLLYLSGKMGVADGPAAVAWLTLAAKANYPKAQSTLGSLYEQGYAGLAQDIKTAGQLYTLAANKGDGAGTLALARLTFNGTGTPADPIKAWCFASLAKERGEESADKMVEQIASSLDEKQRVEAKKQLEAMKLGKSEQPAKPEVKSSEKSSQ